RTDRGRPGAHRNRILAAQPRGRRIGRRGRTRARADGAGRIPGRSAGSHRLCGAAVCLCGAPARERSGGGVPAVWLRHHDDAGIGISLLGAAFDNAPSDAIVRARRNLRGVRDRMRVAVGVSGARLFVWRRMFHRRRRARGQCGEPSARRFRTMKVAIIGAGVAGLAIGWRLAQAGCAGTILESDVAGRSATWAAAGMLSAGAEASSMDRAQVAFGREARNRWPDFARELESAGGRGLLYRETGALLGAHDEADVRSLDDEGKRLLASGARADWLDARAARDMEPALAPHIQGALLVRDDA